METEFVLFRHGPPRVTVANGDRGHDVRSLSLVVSTVSREQVVSGVLRHPLGRRGRRRCPPSFVFHLLSKTPGPSTLVPQ